MPPQKSINYDDSSGIYCFFPFERLKPDGTGVFKIGNTEQTFQKRLNSYHTYYINGVYVLGFIKIFARKGKERPVEFKQILNTVEDWVINKIVDDGGDVLFDKRRTWKEGQSEWVVSCLSQVKKVFDKAVLHFRRVFPDLGFIVDTANEAKTRTEIQANYKERAKLPNKYVAEYIFPLPKPKDAKPKKRKNL